MFSGTFEIGALATAAVAFVVGLVCIDCCEDRAVRVLAPFCRLRLIVVGLSDFMIVVYECSV
jgi:hypothetical protein